MTVRILQSFFAGHTYTVRNGLAKGLNRRGGLGFIPQIRSMSSEEIFLLGLDFNGRTVYDVGGYEGIYTIFFARAIGENGKVITYEPNPTNQDRIRMNVSLNEFNNVCLRPIGLGRVYQTEKLAYLPASPGTGSIDSKIKSKLLRESTAKLIEVEIDSLDNEIFFRHLPKPDFIKIDVEGLEVDVILGMKETLKKYKPALFIEIHGIDEHSKRENAYSLVKILTEYKYVFHHVESDKNITLENTFDAIKGHIYCIA